MQLGMRHWLSALAFAMMVHSTLAFLFYGPIVGMQSPALEDLRGGVEVSFQSAAGAVGNPADIPIASESGAPEVTPVTSGAEEATTEAFLVPVQGLAPIVREAIEVESQPVEELQSTKDVLLPAPKPLAAAEEVTLIKPETHSIISKTQDVTRVSTSARRNPRETPEVVAVSQPSSLGRSALASRKGAFGSGGAGIPGSPGNGSFKSGSGNPGVSGGYFSLVRAWLERHKEYPTEAQLRRQEGKALLRFEMNRDGRVLSYQILRSSGHSLLDRAVKEMIERASPLPVMPSEMREERLELVVPVSFFLRR